MHVGQKLGALISGNGKPSQLSGSIARTNAIIAGLTISGKPQRGLSMKVGHMDSKFSVYSEWQGFSF